MALNFPGVPSNGTPRSRARTVLVGARRRRGRAAVKARDETATAQCDSLIMSYTSHTKDRRSSRRLGNADTEDRNHGFDARGLNLSSAKIDQGPLLFCRMIEVQFLVAGSKA